MTTDKEIFDKHFKRAFNIFQLQKILIEKLTDHLSDAQLMQVDLHKVIDELNEYQDWLDKVNGIMFFQKLKSSTGNCQDES